MAIVNVYVPSTFSSTPQQDHSRKFTFLDSLDAHLHHLSAKGYCPIVGGDFNVVGSNQGDVHPTLLRALHMPHPFSKEEIAAFLSLCTTHNLLDSFRLFSSAARYTAWSLSKHARRDNLGFRLDYILVDPSYRAQLISSNILSDVLGSDHVPVTCTFSDPPPCPPHRAFIVRGNILDSDRESHLRRSDWKLHPVAFSYIQQLWGPFSVDLFATAVNAQLPRFVTRFPCPSALATDAFHHPWSTFQQVGGSTLPLYANPPWIEIPHVLEKIEAERVQLVLIAPIWTDAPWWQDLLGMTRCTPIRLAHTPHLFLPGYLGNTKPVGPPNWEATAAFFLQYHSTPSPLTVPIQDWPVYTTPSDTQRIMTLQSPEQVIAGAKIAIAYDTPMVTHPHP